jgi:hypothetical protein
VRLSPVLFEFFQNTNWKAACFTILDMKNVEYSEWVPIGALVKGLVGMVSSIIIFATLAVFLLSQKLLAEDIFGVAIGWVTLGFILFVLWNFRGLRIQISGDRLLVVYGLFNKQSFLLKEITSCKKTTSFGRYLGIGVRYGFDGSTAYTTSFGCAVEIVPKARRTFVFSSNNPDQVCKIIKKECSPDIL